MTLNYGKEKKRIKWDIHDHILRNSGLWLIKIFSYSSNYGFNLKKEITITPQFGSRPIITYFDLYYDIYGDQNCDIYTCRL